MLTVLLATVLHMRRSRCSANALLISPAVTLGHLTPPCRCYNVQLTTR